MKFEIDTILYIIISIIIIAASILGRKKRKSVQQAPGQPRAEGGDETENFSFEPFSEVKTMFETVSGQVHPGLDDEYVLEDQPLEQIVDEEEMILEEQKMMEEKEALMQEQVLDEEFTKEGVTDGEEAQKVSDETEDEEFFGDPSDIRRAIIYSEILKRPEY